MGARLMAIVAEGDRGRVYLPPTQEMRERAERQAGMEARYSSSSRCRLQRLELRYGTYGDLFTPRQLVALTTFSDWCRKPARR